MPFQHPPAKGTAISLHYDGRTPHPMSHEMMASLFEGVVPSILQVRSGLLDFFLVAILTWFCKSHAAWCGEVVGAWVWKWNLVRRDGRVVFCFVLTVRRYIWWQFCNRCVTPSLEPTPSYQNAPDVIGQDLVHEFSHFFASDFKVCWWDLISSCKHKGQMAFVTR